MSKNIAIIGGGITGLTAAYELTKQGYAVTVFENGTTLGGLANGFSGGVWAWKLEKAYHHFFTNDQAIIHLAKKLGMKKDIMILSPTTSIYLNHEEYPFDSPMHILQFPGLPFIDRLRTGMTAFIMKCNPFWKPLESITAKKLFRAINGTRAWNIIWGPLLDAKFGPYAEQIAASWLWARLYKRTAKLGYFRGGFSYFVDTLASAVRKNGGIIKTNTPVTNIVQKDAQFLIHNSLFDKVVLTTPSPIATKLISFPKAYVDQLSSIPHLWAQTLILETDDPILTKTYWLNINEPGFPFLAIVQHTNMINKKHYGNHHICYIGNYLPDTSPYLKMTKEALLKKFLPYLKKINPDLNSKFPILNSYLFTAPNAQPVHTMQYSLRAPKFETPIKNIFLANLDSIYPWDRGTNYAVELGQKVAKKLV